MRLPTSFQLPTLLVLAATPLLTTANPISQANPPAWTPPAPNLTTTSLEILSASLTFDISYVSAHHGRLYTNALDPDALCQTNTPSQLFTPLATFVLDNTTETLRLT
ncbi:hypothetical protein UCDDS831_g07657 [Diplodia seriata]|uniref:Uncharacterized protein n=1 Tax=Diplodia seriata TaxID=420778 RepID=A0A0G2DXW9_9PEZI|nr:hypothetical protein UCDDS831_g07657 [Diplodia seriata]